MKTTYDKQIINSQIIQTDGLVNYENYGIYNEILKTGTITINTKDINKNTWREYFNTCTNILLDGIERDIIQKCFVTIDFGNNINCRLSLIDYWFNLIMWYGIIYTDQTIQPKHVFYDKHIDGKSIKRYIDKFYIEINRKKFNITYLNNVIADTLKEFVLVDKFAFFLCNTFNLEDTVALMNKSEEFNQLMHYDFSNIPLQDIKNVGNSVADRMIEIMQETDIDGYKHCLAIPLGIGEGANPKQFREFNVVEGTKPNNEGGIFPHAITTSFITGGISKPYDYFMDASTARIAQILTKENVGTSGYFARQLGLNNLDTTLHQDPDYDCHTRNFVEVTIKDERVLNMLKNRYYRMTPNGVDHLIKKNQTELIGKTILLRSPITCASAARGEGICYKCYGDLAYVNNIISPGRYATEILSAKLTQRLLSAKHLLETAIRKLNWCPEFNNYFNIEINCITLEFDGKLSQYSLIIDPDDIDLENEDSEIINDSEDNYNEYITQFAVKTPQGDEIPIHTENYDKIYISNSLNDIIRKKSNAENGRFDISFTSLTDMPLFFIILHNNDLQKALDDVKDTIDKTSITCAKGMTKDKLLDRFISTIIASNLNIDSVHLEVLLMNQIKNVNDVLEKPNWLYPNEDYQILTLKQALERNSNVVISMLNQKLEQQFVNPLTFKKHGASFVDLFFMEQPQEFIKNNDIIDPDIKFQEEGTESEPAEVVERIIEEADEE